jgi:site-specific DNA recombinase
LKNLLNLLGVKTVTEGEWHEGSIRGILVNEKYKGDCHLQKTFTPENKRSQTRQNRGEVQSYYITDNHPAIVSTELWDQVQEERRRRKTERNIGSGGTDKYQNRYPLSGLLVCPHCSRSLRRRQVYKKKVQWLCSTYIEKGKQACPGIRIDDIELQKQIITEPTVVEEVEQNGKKHYRYTSKTEFDSRCRKQPACTETADGSVLPGVNRPRRTVIKL